MDDSGGEQEFLSRGQCLTAFDGGWAFDGSSHSITAAAGCNREPVHLTAVMEDSDGGRGGQ